MARYVAVLIGIIALLMLRSDVFWLLMLTLAANQAGYVGRLGLPLGNTIVSQVGLGSRKTWGAYYFGAILATIMLYFLWAFMPVHSMWFGITEPIDILWRGPLIGLGVVLGDHTNSFIKRRLRIEPGAPFEFDHVDWAVGGSIAFALVLDNVRWEELFWLIVIAYPIHCLGNRNSYDFGWRNAPH